MTEMIGKVRLNLDDYAGKDLYSDGDIEDRMLKIAREVPPAEFDRIVAEEKSWPVMYHFSSIRTNIISWYPFNGHENVLEVGSGCGAITGALASRAGKVTCVELSRKRSLINAWRSREMDNLEIRVGNFQDVEKRLTDAYDIITLIGVLEYASLYISAGDPYAAFLRQIRTHLKKEGRLLIAIENRIGMKYWAGCREDHTGNYFEGIEGYPGKNNTARTFSKPELETLFREAGFTDFAFYYPYPDYKFPMSIYSDRYLPKTGDLRMNRERNFDRARWVLFNEDAAWDSVVKSGLFPQFSNSFLAVLSGGDA